MLYIFFFLCVILLDHLMAIIVMNVHPYIYQQNIIYYNQPHFGCLFIAYPRHFVTSSILLYKSYFYISIFFFFKHYIPYSTIQWSILIKSILIFYKMKFYYNYWNQVPVWAPKYVRVAFFTTHIYTYIHVYI